MHYNEALWVDYVRGLVEPGLAREMQQHLAGGCRRCTALHTSLVAVEDTFQEDRVRPVPEALARMARAVFPPRRLFWRELPRELATLVTGSLPQLHLQGVRASIDAARHFTFRAENYWVDMQVERQTQPAAHLLTGQLMAEPGAGAVSGVPVLVLDGDTEITRQSTNEFGEFQLDLPTGVHPRVVLLVDQESRALELPIGRLSPDDDNDGSRTKRLPGE